MKREKNYQIVVAPDKDLVYIFISLWYGLKGNLILIKSILSPRYLFVAVYMQIACQTDLKPCQSPFHPNRICVFICNTSTARAKARSILGSGNSACLDGIPAGSLNCSLCSLPGVWYMS